MENNLKSNLLEYRKALRAMMHFYDSAWSLYDLFETELNNIKGLQIVEFHDLATIMEYWDKPSDISRDAFTEVSASVFNWAQCACSNDDYKANKGSIYIEIYTLLDYWATEPEPSDSISGIGVYGYRMNSVTGHAKTWEDFEIKVDIKDESGISNEGEPEGPMKIKVFSDAFSGLNGKYEGDYAVGLYDLSQLNDETAVRESVISDIKDLLEKWGS